MGLAGPQKQSYSSKDRICHIRYDYSMDQFLCSRSVKVLTNLVNPMQLKVGRPTNMFDLSGQRQVRDQSILRGDGTI